jgi:hypothetical protein
VSLFESGVVVAVTSVGGTDHVTRGRVPLEPWIGVAQRVGDHFATMSEHELRELRGSIVGDSKCTWVSRHLGAPRHWRHRDGVVRTSRRL